MQVISCSDGTSLHFPDKAMYERYKAEELQLTLKYYAEIRAKYGVWAGNQGKFVATRKELNDLDGTKMEDLLAAQPAASGPVAWAQLGMRNGHTYVRYTYECEPYPPPVDVVRNLNLVPLYAAPRPAPDRVPLTEAQIEDCIDDANRRFNGRHMGPCGQQMTTYDDWKHWLARAIEAAHHITAKG